ncbi:MerR family transcriptional regulator [Weissella muntiaci]|uniref:MerR family transcriptional regulator n=1 Tax=Weissella muntiaci TaxID=2508881 RepID=A0A6C2CAA4_9LACO|nr:MerR family transcriptional regulator [Weissella muntiaci]TYC51080.1 MerR family transcriptional regulator [Weissella muntiaci]
MNETYYSIGQVARKLGVSVETLRYYDKEGLLPFVGRDEAGRRRFSSNDMHLLRMIMYLKLSGLSVAKISEFVNLRQNDGDSSLKERFDILLTQENELEEKLEEIKITLAYMKFKKWYFMTSIEAGTESIHLIEGSDQIKDDSILEEEYIAYLKNKGDKAGLEEFMPLSQVTVVDND